MSARAAGVGALVCAGGLGFGLIGGGTALAAGPDCGASAGVPAGATAESSWSSLQSAVSGVSSGSSAVFYLEAPMLTTSGGLSVPDGASVTLDLNGCDLSITTPGDSAAAVGVPWDSSLTVEDTSSSVTADQGTLTATGGAGTSAGFGAGAGIGGDDAGVGASATAGSVTISGGNVIATGGYGGSGEGGGGAGIGGGGGSPGAANNDGVGGGSLEGAVTISAGAVSAAGGTSAPDDYTGTIVFNDGAAIGGGGSGGWNAGSGGNVILSGGQLSTSGALGIGGGGYPQQYYNNGAVTVTGGMSDLTGEVAGALTIDQGATVSVPAGTALAVDGSATSAGTIQLGGAITGSGSLDNNGAIVVHGDAWSADGEGPASVPGALIRGYVYELTFHVPSGMPISPVWVFGPTLSAGGESLPTEPDATWVQGGISFSDTTNLPPFGSPTQVSVIPLQAQYSVLPRMTARLSSTKPRSRFGWWHTPVRVSFTCTPVAGITLSGDCPGPVTVSPSGIHHLSSTFATSNGSIGSVTVSGIKIDRNKPTVKVTGAVNRGYYPGRAPKVHCRASERLSGIASCKLTIRRRLFRSGYVETVKATAKTKAGVSRTASTSFTIAKR